MTGDVAGPANIIILSLDSVRPESVSCYDDRFPTWRKFPKRASTPNIDDIAAAGVRYETAITQAPFTPAAHASMLTGLNPYNHGIRQILGHRLRPGVQTLAERLRDEGFETGAFIGAHALDSRYGLDTGFDSYDESFERTAENWELGYRRPCEEVMDDALSWLAETGDAPAFLFVHFFDAHDGDLPEATEGVMSGTMRRLLRPVDERLGRPLEIRKGYGRRFQLRQTSRIDAQIGRLRSYLQTNEEFDQSMIFLLADHGDAFGVHGEFNHREYLYDTTLRIPFIYKPDAAWRAATDREVSIHSSEVVRATDIYPTVLDRLGVDPGDTDGEPLDGTRAADATAYAETRFEEPGTESDTLRHSYAAMRSRQWKLIVNRLTGQRELYDLAADPAERKNRYGAAEPVPADLERRLDAVLASDGQRTNERMTDREMEAVSEHLEGLGYL